MIGATPSLQEFAALYTHDAGKKCPKIPKALDDAFRAGGSPGSPPFSRTRRPGMAVGASDAYGYILGSSAIDPEAGICF